MQYVSLVHKTLLVDCEENLQIQRAMVRSQLNEAQVNCYYWRHKLAASRA